MSSQEQKEIKKESAFKRLTQNVYALAAGAIILIIIAAAFGAYMKTTGSRIYTDKSDIEAPLISLAPRTSGVLQNISVNIGDKVAANSVVAQVGNELVKAKSAGIITSTADNIGKLVNAGESVVTMIDPNDLRVVAHLEEDKGLADVHIGQNVVFTADAFGSKKYTGIVDAISPTAHSGDIVFNISDKRAVQQFDIKIRFNTDLSPELSNGMSTKVWIYKN
jgi:multidrug resistance efflux pump